MSETIIKHITVDDVKQMTDIEGLILQGCGGDPAEWAAGINKLLTEEGILLGDDVFRDIYVFEHDGHTNILFSMENVKLDIGKLAMWRLKSHSTFGGYWLSDYLPNRLGVQFKQFEKLSKPRKILYAGVGNRRGKSNIIDLMLPITEIERANVIFEAIGFKPEKGAEASEHAQDMGKKKDSPSRSSSKNSRDKSTSQNNNSSRTSEKPSVTAKLEAFDKALKQQDAKPKARIKGKGR